MTDTFYCKTNPSCPEPFEVREHGPVVESAELIQSRGGLLKKDGAFTTPQGFQKATPESWSAIQILCSCGSYSMFHKVGGVWQ